MGKSDIREVCSLNEMDTYLVGLGEQYHSKDLELYKKLLVQYKEVEKGIADLGERLSNELWCKYNTDYIDSILIDLAKVNSTVRELEGNSKVKRAVFQVYTSINEESLEKESTTDESKHESNL